MSQGSATIHIDGAARGNPGPAACAFVIAMPGGQVIEQATRLGRATNNVAEYTALILALTKAIELGLKDLDVYSDSELLVKQINGEYRVKSPDLMNLYERAIGQMNRIDEVHVSHVRREVNKRADQLCNDALDGRDSTAPAASKSAPSQKAPPSLRQRVDGDALDCLTAAARSWQAGASTPTPGHVWDQLWSIFEESGILKKPRARGR